jgi:phage gpG-like protein
MPATTITVADSATPELQKLIGQLRQRQPLLKRMGRTLEQTLKRHFIARNQEPNKTGFPKKNFWEQIATATTFTDATNDTATVTISDPRLATKIYGGTIRPKKAKNIAIPLTPEASQAGSPRGAGAGETHLTIRRSKGGKRTLFIAAGKKAIKDQEETLLWVLVHQVTHHPDPKALPTQTTLLPKLTSVVTRYLQKI